MLLSLKPQIMSEENDNTSSGCRDTLGLIVLIFLIYLFFGSIWPRLFPNIKMMGDEHDLFASESPIIEHPSVKTKSLDENTIKQHLIGKKLENSGWTFASLNEFEHFEIESVSTDLNQDKTYIIKSVLKDWEAGKRYNSRFFIKYDKNQGQDAIKDALLGGRMILEVAAYSYELIVPEKDVPANTNETDLSREVQCLSCSGRGWVDYPCEKCKGKGYLGSNDCFRCNGYGKRKAYCTADGCNGTGWVPESRIKTH